jgi:thioredoxin-like negative regulator of GroEL
MNRKDTKRSVTASASNGTEPRQRKALVPAVLALTIVAGTWAVVESSTHRLLVRATSAAQRKEFAEAERLAVIVLQRDPDSVKALFLAGVSAKETRGDEAAIAYFEKIPNDGTMEAMQAMFARAEFAFQRGWASDSEKLFLRIVELDPTNIRARERLLYIYSAQGRMWEVSHQVLPLLKSGIVDLNHLIAASSSKKLMDAKLPFVLRCIRADPTDPLPRLLEAKWAIHHQELGGARNILEEIVRVHPTVVDAQAALGLTLLETGTAEEIAAWHEQLPEGSESHPDIWFVRGLWSVKLAQPKPAVRCFGEAVRRNPNHAAANYQMSTALAAVGQAEQAEVFATRARKLARMALLVDELVDLDKILDIVTLLRELGRVWEAAGWCRLAIGNDAVWAKPTLDQLLFELADEDALTKRSSNLALQLDLSMYSLPSFQNSQPQDSIIPSPPSTDSQVSFRDIAVKVGLTFTYSNGAVGDNSESLFELDGGGVGVLDYDLDGWPDLYLTQGGPLPRRQEMSPHDYCDGLFRNQSGKGFVDVSGWCGVKNKLYSQGLAVGDFDSDGFPDLYIANIGANTLYLNNGDGTFQDVSSSSGTQGNVWTSSCLLADLNGDALPDIYAVNYIEGDKLYTQECRIDTQRRCAPIEHPAAQDQVYLNGGDGAFSEITDHCGIVAPDGRGLGIVAADFDGSKRLSLFVANDMSANFFFQNETLSSEVMPKFVERAILNGLAYNGDGVSQACMGIAAGDANQDGLIDLFVTNFYHEANNFFVQQSDGSFRDDLIASELQQATYPNLGWGTQFVDAELDGIPDLLVTNGHVHDPWEKDLPYHMHPQFFRGKGAGRFEEVPAEQLGPYFTRKHLGRAMARLDWNRDGLEDVCIMHLDSPVALITNETITEAHRLSLTVKGVNSNRDAIGTVVQITSGGRAHIRQLMAGDGYQCSNERRMVFGLGDAEVLDEIQVRWPSGLEQTFRDIQSDQELIVVEGNSSIWVRH